MKSKSMLISVGISVALAILATGAAISAQDRYSVKVPNGLAFSEFKGYENWQVVSVSHNGDMLAVILGNPAMIEAYKAGIPGNGKPFPDGAKLAKIHWSARKNESAPGQPLVAGPPSMTRISWLRMARGSRIAGDGGTPSLSMTPRPIHSGRAQRRISHRRETTPSAEPRALSASLFGSRILRALSIGFSTLFSHDYRR